MAVWTKTFIDFTFLSSGILVCSEVGTCTEPYSPPPSQQPIPYSSRFIGYDFIAPGVALTTRCKRKELFRMYGGGGGLVYASD